MIDLDELAATLETFPALLAAVQGPIDRPALGTGPEPVEWPALEVIDHLGGSGGS